MNTKISIIIPVFNTEKFLPKCLNSLINQTINDIEIICIDDHSTDNSLKILKEYSQKDNRIKILEQKENHKQGAARNRGLDIAQGEYITFVDSDDWIDNDYCEKLYNAVNKYNVNIAIAPIIREKKHHSKPYIKIKREATYNDVAEIINATQSNLCTAGKLYKRELIKDLRFIENSFFEDIGYTIRAIYKSKSAITIKDTFYHYVSNPNSTVKIKDNEKAQHDKILAKLDVVNFAKNNNINIRGFLIDKEKFFIFKVKHYIDHKDFLLLGIKIFSKKESYKNNILMEK